MAANPVLRLLAFRALLALALLVSIAALPASAESGILHLVVRDVDTRYAIRARVVVEGPKALSMETDANGTFEASLPAGEYQIEITAAGYRTMRTHTLVQPPHAFPIGIMLDPMSPPCEEQLLQSHLKPGLTLLHGYATDDQGHPVAGVRVRLRHGRGEATTNARGYYELSTPTPPDMKRDIPGIDTLIAQKPGYKTIIHKNIFVAGEDGGGAFLDMVKGKGVIEFDDTHVLLRH